jgi:hypothetical protein
LVAASFDAASFDAAGEDESGSSVLPLSPPQPSALKNAPIQTELTSFFIRSPNQALAPRSGGGLIQALASRTDGTLQRLRLIPGGA